MPTVSVVMATYNGARFLREQLDSIVTQTYPISELIIQDDGSTDNTLDIVQEYAEKYPYIRINRNAQNIGWNQNFVNLFHLATSDFIAIADQDDIWYRQKIERQVAEIGDKPLCLSYCYKDKEYTEHGKQLGDPREDFESFLFSGNAPGHCMLVRRSFIDAIDVWNPSISYDWWLSVQAQLRGGIAVVREALNWHRPHADSAGAVIRRSRGESERVTWQPYVFGWGAYRRYQRREDWQFLYTYIRDRVDRQAYPLVYLIVTLLLSRSIWSLFHLCFVSMRHRDIIHDRFAGGRGLKYVMNVVRGFFYPLMWTYNHNLAFTKKVESQPAHDEAMPPSVSVVMTTYNGARFLREQLDSILAQTYPPLEVIIQDDGSTDETADIVESYAATHNFIHFYRNEHNLGWNKNFITAFQRAKGDYIAICDQDDIWYPTKIVNQLVAIGKGDLCFAYSYRDPEFTTHGNDIGAPQANLESMLFTSNVAGHYMLVRTAFVKSIKEWPNASYDWWLCLCSHLRHTLVVKPMPLNWRRPHADSASALMREEATRGRGATTWQPYLFGWRAYRRYQRRADWQFLYTYILAHLDQARNPLAYDITKLLLDKRPLSLLRLCMLTMRHRREVHDRFAGDGMMNKVRGFFYPLMWTYNNNPSFFDPSNPPSFRIDDFRNELTN